MDLIAVLLYSLDNEEVKLWSNGIVYSEEDYNKDEESLKLFKSLSSVNFGVFPTYTTLLGGVQVLDKGESIRKDRKLMVDFRTRKYTIEEVINC